MFRKRFWHKAYLATLFLFAVLAALITGLVLVQAKAEMLSVMGQTEAFELAFNSMFKRSLFLCISGFFVLAAGLYIIMLSLSKPIEDLAFTEQRFAAGNYGIRSAYKSKDEIGRLARSFNHMAKSVESSISSLEENAEMKQQLVDNLSHELRTPLTAINGYADYVWQAELNQEEIYDEMEKIKNETQRLLRISNRMLEISAIRDANRKGGNKNPINPVPLTRLLGQVESTLRPVANSLEVNLEIRNPENDYIIQGDPAMLESLFVNLVHNAMKACEPGQGVIVEYTPSKEGLIVKVIDSGCGMSAEQLSHLGEEFYRVDKARSRKHGGAGLGVALCFQIANSHEATLSYESEPGQGTTATIVFPGDIVRLADD